ncbi:MAG: glycosyltransferase family 1 protein [Mariprofundaceae bacterium]
MTLATKHLLIDGREFVTDRRTGIGRFLEGLLLAVTEVHRQWCVRVLLSPDCTLPNSLKERVEVISVKDSGDALFGRECSRLSAGADLFLSPYPKLPLAKLHCPMIHTVHDVLYLTHEVYRGSWLKCWLSKQRLRMALNQTDLTWFDSRQTERECEELFGKTQHAKIRYPAIESAFVEDGDGRSNKRDYFLYVGNGLPHKNLDVVLHALEGMEGTLKCVGVKPEFTDALLAKYPGVQDKVEFLQGIDDAALLTLYRSALALLMPSTAEGYGYPPLEALACGTPAVVADIPVLKETTGGFAMYCLPDDVDGWQAAMSQIQKGIHEDTQAEPLAIWIGERQGVTGWQPHIRDMEAVMESN